MTRMASRRSAATSSRARTAITLPKVLQRCPKTNVARRNAQVREISAMRTAFRRVGVGAFGLVCTFAAGTALRAQDHPADSLEVRKVTFTGAHAFHAGDLQAAVVTAASGCKVPVPVSVIC